MSTLAWFLNTIYQGQKGWCELCYIIGDPDDRAHCSFQQKWYVLADQDRILKRIEELQALGYNVYVSASTYRKPIRDKTYAYPSRAIAIDDAPAGEYTFRVQTSPNSQHAWMLADRLLDVSTRERIARNAAYATGGDKGGWDATQLVRVPGGFNTKAKYGDPFPVHLVEGTGRYYTLDELCTRWPEAPQRVDVDAIDLDWRAIEHEIARVDSILRRIPQHTLTYKRLTGQVRCKNHKGEDSRTDTRWALACDLRAGTAGPRLPDEEIAALLITHNWGTLADKGSNWLYADIARCIDGAHKKHPNVTPEPTHGGHSQAAQRLPQAERKSRARRDRPQRVTPDCYLAWLHDQKVGAGTIMMTRKDVAAALSISVGTVDRLERTLRDRGEIERRTNAARTYSYIVLVGAINISDVDREPAEKQSEEVLSRPQLETANTEHQDREKRTINDVSIEETHSQERSTSRVPSPALRLSDAMRAAVEAAANEHGRVTKPRVKHQFARYFPHMPWSDCKYHRAIHQRAAARQFDRLTAWAQASTTQPHELKRKARSLAYQQRKAVDAGHETKAFVLGRQANIIEDEIEVRILRGEIRRKGSKRSHVPSSMPLLDGAPPAMQAPIGACVPSPAVEPEARSERDEVHASIARDLASWGKFENAHNMALEIDNGIYHSGVSADIHAAELAANGA